MVRSYSSPSSETAATNLPGPTVAPIPTDDELAAIVAAVDSYIAIEDALNMQAASLSDKSLSPWLVAGRMQSASVPNTAKHGMPAGWRSRQKPGAWGPLFSLALLASSLLISAAPPAVAQGKPAVGGGGTFAAGVPAALTSVNSGQVNTSSPSVFAGFSAARPSVPLTGAGAPLGAAGASGNVQSICGTWSFDDSRQTVRVLLGAPRQKVDLDLPDGGSIYSTDGSLVAKIGPRSSWSLNLASAGSAQSGGPNRLALTASPPRGVRGPKFVFTGKGSLDTATTANLDSTRSTIANTSFVPRGLPSETRAPGIENRFALTTEAGYLIVPDARSSEGAPPLVGINGQLYRGSLYLRPFVTLSGSGANQTSSTAIGVINIIKIEDYLLSVVPSEVPASWPVEVLKAQAIAARSYVVANLGKHKADGYDVKDSVEDQVYRGVISENDETNVACAKTAGLVLKQNDQVISAFFHSTSGGSTELAENVWSKPLPYLKSVTDYDDASPHFTWQRSFTVAQLNKLLGFQNANASGQGLPASGMSQVSAQISAPISTQVSAQVSTPISTPNSTPVSAQVSTPISTPNSTPVSAQAAGDADQISGIFVVGRHKNDAQRVKHVAVVGTRGGRMLTGSEVRRLLNLPSTQFSVLQADGAYVFSGRGNGHGLGLSQWGAKALADKGYNAGQILSYYYKDVTIESMSELAGCNGSI